MADGSPSAPDARRREGPVPPGRGRIAVALLALLAGCSGVAPAVNPDPGGDAPTATEALTPVPVPPSPTDPGAGRMPRWASGGRPDSAALATAHAAALEGSYAVRAVETVRAPDGSVRARRNVTVRLGPSHGRYRVTLAATGREPEPVPLPGGDAARATFWSDGERRLVRAVDRNGSVRYDAFRLRFLPGGTLAGTANYWTGVVLPGGQPWTDVEPLVAALDVRVAGVERVNGTRLYRLEAARIADRSLFVETERVAAPRAVRFRALVRPDGAVRAYRLVYAARRGGKQVRVERTVRYAAIGGTTVERPGWYDAARAATGGTGEERGVAPTLADTSEAGGDAAGATRPA